jgi:hypothetical protein
MTRFRLPRIERRREFLAAATAGLLRGAPSESLTPIVITVQVLFDRGARSGHGLRDDEIAMFRRYQERARREYAVSGIIFDLRALEGAYLRTQGYSEIPDRFLSRNAINLFVTATLAYDIDRDRTGGCSLGPRARRSGLTADPFYKTFLGLTDAGETTLVHEYAHHFTLDTLRNPTAVGNFWADLRNDYWLWRQRQGVPITAFRACARSEFARLGA